MKCKLPRQGKGAQSGIKGGFCGNKMFLCIDKNKQQVIRLPAVA